MVFTDRKSGSKTSSDKFVTALNEHSANQARLEDRFLQSMQQQVEEQRKYEKELQEQQQIFQQQLLTSTVREFGGILQGFLMPQHNYNYGPPANSNHHSYRHYGSKKEGDRKRKKDESDSSNED
jgi:hypothetical protein